MLAERKEVYKKYKDNKDELRKQKLLTPAKYKTEFSWLKEVDSLALANAWTNLQTAYNNFLKIKILDFLNLKVSVKIRILIQLIAFIVKK